MLARFSEIKNSKNFPLDKIVGFFEGDADRIFHYAEKYEENENSIPLFEINSEKYIPICLTSNKKKPAYPGMSESWDTIIEYAKALNYPTLPVITETIEQNYGDKSFFSIYGLIKYVAGRDLWRVYSGVEYGDLQKINKNAKYNLNEDFNKMIKTCAEYHSGKLIHLDLNLGNFIKDFNGDILIVDISLGTKHMRPYGDYFNERAVSYHWAPELLQGGKINEKTAVYGLGETMKFVLRMVHGFEDYVQTQDWKVWKDVLLACTQKDQVLRPLFKDLV